MKTLIALYFFIGLNDYKSLFNEGLSAYEKRDYKGAIVNFSKSYELKKHSKTSYYISISYFKMGIDSLAEKFAQRAQSELPILPDDPYQINIQHIYEYCRLAPRFRKVRFKIEQSDEKMTSKRKKEQEELEKELRSYYPDTPEGQRKLMDDLMLVQSRSLFIESELQLDTATLKFYRAPIIDSL
jgi:tetratricopeptide (TPR) repeat protein